MPKPNVKVGNSQTIALAETLGSSVSNAGSLLFICLNPWGARVGAEGYSSTMEEHLGKQRHMDWIHSIRLIARLLFFFRPLPGGIFHSR